MSKMTPRSVRYFRRRKMQRLMDRLDNMPPPMGMYYLDKNREPRLATSVGQWAECFESQDRIVDKTTIGDANVSTVFLGLDSGYGLFGEAPPLLYETMIFGGPHDSYQRRYATRKEAEEGHLEACKLVLTPKEEEDTDDH